MSARELIVLVTMAAVWGFHFVVIKLAVGAVPPLFYAAMRMTLVAVVLAAFLKWRPGRMALVLIAGLCLGAVNYALMFTGISRATASASAIAIELYVPFATILSIVFLGERVGWRRILGISLAFSGIAIIALSKGEARIGVGVALVASAAFIESVGAILVKRSIGFKPHELLAWYSVMGTVFLWAGTWAIEDGQLAALRAANGWLIAVAVIYSALGASVFAHTAYYWLLQRLPVSQVAPSALLTTMLAVIFSIVFLDEPVTMRFVVGGVMALIGVAIVLLRAPKGRIVEPGAPEPVAMPPAAAHAESTEDDT